MLFNQKKIFYTLFNIELWERFSFYGLQTILIFYLVNKLSLPLNEAITLFSTFHALIHSLVFIGNWISETYLGIKRTMILGLIILLIGYTLISLPIYNIYYIYFTLSTIAIGICLFKVNPTNLLALYYKKEKPTKRNTIYTLYYMAINIGSLLSMLLIPWINNKYNWNIALFICSLSIIITLFTLYYNYHELQKYGNKKDYTPLTNKNIIYTSIYIISLISILTWLLQYNNITNILVEIIIIITSIYLITKVWFLSQKEKKHMIVVIMLIIETIIFFILYNQIPTTINIFSIHNVNPYIWGYKIDPKQYQALNPFWIIIFSPILAYIYNSKYSKKIHFTSQYAYGMLLSALSFLILPIGIKITNTTDYLNSNWLIISYLFQSIGELIISSLGLAIINKLTPTTLINLTTGIWFLTTSIASIISGQIANFIIIPNDINTNIYKSLNIFNNAFLKIGIFSLIISIIFFLITPKLQSLLKNKNQSKINKKQ